MTTTGKTRAELAAWLDRWNENGAAPSAETVAEFLGIELAPEPTPPVGQRRRSPGGVEAVKTEDGSILRWRRYGGAGVGTWFTDAEVADWEVIIDAPEVPEGVLNAAAQWIAADVCPCGDECDSGCFGTGDRLARVLADAGLLVGTLPEAPKCDREHLPDGHVAIDLRDWPDATLRTALVSAADPVAAAARAELARRGES